MAKFTQVRLGQITGSAPNLITALTDSVVANGEPAPSLAAADLGDILKAYGQTLSAISGKGDFFGQQVGQLKHDLGAAHGNQVRLIATGTRANSGLQVGIAQHSAPTGVNFASQGASLVFGQGASSGNESISIKNFAGSQQVGASNVAITVKASAGGINVDAKKELRLNSDEITHLTGSTGVVIEATDNLVKIEGKGSGAAKGVLVEAPAGGITLKSSLASNAGAVVINAQAATSKISVQNAGSALLEIEAGNVTATTAASVRVLKTTESNFVNGAAALLVSGGVRIAKHVDLVAGDLIANAGEVLLKTDGKKVKLGSAGVPQLSKVVGTQKGEFTTAGTAGYKTGVSASAGVAVHGGPAGGVILTGAFGPMLGGCSLFNFGAGTEGALATYKLKAELVHFKQKFATSGSGQTSIIAAINDLDGRISSTDQSSYKLVQAADASGTPSVVVSLEAGSAANFKTAAKNQLDVFVNGQLLISGASDADGDYKVDATGINKVQFFFPLKADDVIRVLDKQ